MNEGVELDRVTKFCLVLAFVFWLAFAIAVGPFWAVLMAAVVTAPIWIVLEGLKWALRPSRY